MLKELGDSSGKEVLMLVVDYPPGGVDPVHRHDAHGFIYVLEGTIVMQVSGGEEGNLDARTDVLKTMIANSAEMVSVSVISADVLGRLSSQR